MSGRPVGAIPVWATLVSYPAGTEPWAGTDTKAHPGLSKLARGLDPGDRPPAQWLNWAFNGLGVQLLVHDAVEALNWGVTHNMSTWTASGHTCMAHDRDRGWFWATGGSGGVGALRYSHNGRNWSTPGAVYSTPPLSFIGLAFNLTGVGLICEDGNHVYRLPTANAASGATTITQITVASALNFRGIYYQADEDVFLLWGRNATGSPAVWTADETGAVTSRPLPDQASYASAITLAAVGIQGGVVFADVTTGYRQWSAASVVGSWTDDGEPSFTSAPRAISFNASENLYMVTCQGGHVYTSATGASWTLAGNAGVKFMDHGLACFGATWVALGLATSLAQGDQARLLVSVDNGQTWTWIPYPLPTTADPACLTRLDDLFMLPSTGGDVVASLRSR